MAQTITLRAHGATLARDARFNDPCSSRASRYFISPACPAAIHLGKWLSSGESVAGAMPQRSKPAVWAARFMTVLISSILNFYFLAYFAASRLPLMILTRRPLRAMLPG